jgi:tryptophanyl-tRNA synthetase
MNKPVILTGLRANNDLHIGNYFGAILPIVDMAKKRSDDYQINLFIPDLHSFTTPINHDDLYAQSLNNAKLYIAAGLPIDKPDVHIYRQSFVPAHSELTWILDCFTGFGEMSRMTQFKDKSTKLGDSQISVGLFNYPVLMAADILLYGAKYVPVGDDQTQHLEFTRDIAERVNKKFGDIMTIPEPVKKQHEFFGTGQGLRIKDLVDPNKKMSKSDESGKGVIFLTDPVEVSVKKIMSATTDDLASVNYDQATQPGIANLIQILALLTNETPEQVGSRYKGMEKYGDFKKIVAQELATFLTDFQSKLDDIDDESVIKKLESSEEAMRAQSSVMLSDVQKAVGLRR